MQAQGAGRVSKPVRRSRIPLSCEACRARKLKCNREEPCQNCSTRGEQTACIFKGSTKAALLPSHGDRNADKMRQRIDHLEGMVKRLITQRQDIPPPTIASPGGPQGPGAVRFAGSTPVGTTVIDGLHSVYKSTDDWYDVLQEVNELKKAWSNSLDEPGDVQPAPSNSVDGTSLLFGHVERIGILEILSSLPSKPDADKLVQWFFDCDRFPLSIPPIVHEPTFMREYNDHWKDPSQTSVIWVGLLFSIVGITMLAVQFGGPPEYQGISEPLFDLYRLRTAQCLLAGDIAKCLPYTIETLRLNATAELNRKDDNSHGLWIMTGVIVRAAVNMGYHRDPDHNPSLSILKAEYRRRVWLSVKSVDDVASFLCGFPRMIPAINSDTKEPRNLYDQELGEETTILPWSRPLSEPTSATYLIAKARLFHGLGEVIDFMNGPCPDNYTRVIEIDQLLHNSWSSLPAHMRVDVGQVERGSLEKPSDYSKLHLALLYHYGVCTLHRKFIQKDRQDPPGHVSWSRCIASSLALIDYQGLLQSPWYTFSQTRQMLARPAMTLLLELESRRRGPDLDSVFRTESILLAFERAVRLWKDASNSCDEARKVYNILNHLLQSFTEGEYQEQQNVSDMPDERDIDWAWWDEFVDGSRLWDEHATASHDLARGL
ncbi:hypothetical protein BDW59DRAFT_140885 [Aspergillus cavernicola]|uniref:Zn(2)-C6 fungal-type domain-containing protein n=1 Tax=Aspergillus cavernicola TaxID=176166 RepID=A0ABR4ISV2_9EURO